MSDYTEIKALEGFIKEHSVEVSAPSNIPPVHDLITVFISIQNETIKCYIQDEYYDLQSKDPRIHVVLALREFQLIEESTDYLHWCNMMGAESTSEALRNYYQETVKSMINIRKHFDRQEITSFILDLDFQLNSGAMQFLRNL